MDSDTDDISAMSEQDFLAEHKRAREAIEALQERYRLLNAEFDRRVAASWRSAS